jgi:hypothetical protein
VTKLGRTADIRLKRPPIAASALPILEVRDLQLHFGKMLNIRKH